MNAYTTRLLQLNYNWTTSHVHCGKKQGHLRKKIFFAFKLKNYARQCWLI